jgi:hypothetical protein
MEDTHTKHGHSPDENPAVSYERGDLDIFAVGKFGVGLAIGTGVAVVMMWGLFHWLINHQDQNMEPMPDSVMAARKGMMPPEPHLQSMGNPSAPDISRGDLRSPSVELEQLREDEARQAQMYAWVDPAKGVVRIPIEVAKEMVLKKGLPVKVTAEGQVSMARNPGESIGTSSAAQPQRVYQTGAAAIGSAQLTKLPEEDKPEGEKSEPGEKK